MRSVLHQYHSVKNLATTLSDEASDVCLFLILTQLSFFFKDNLERSAVQHALQAF